MCKKDNNSKNHDEVGHGCECSRPSFLIFTECERIVQRELCAKTAISPPKPTSKNNKTIRTLSLLCQSQLVEMSTTESNTSNTIMHCIIFLSIWLYRGDTVVQTDTETVTKGQRLSSQPSTEKTLGNFKILTKKKKKLSLCKYHTQNRKSVNDKCLAYLTYRVYLC